jgi:hypothetical protein
VILAALLAATTIHLTAARPQPAAATVRAPAPIEFVNDTSEDVTLSTSMRGLGTTIPAGGSASFATLPGLFTFAVDGASAGSFAVEANLKLRVARTKHGIVLSGTAPAGRYQLFALRGGGNPQRVIWVTVGRGKQWSVAVRPRRLAQYSLQGLLGQTPWVAVRRYTSAS